jgi:hypothetical protein
MNKRIRLTDKDKVNIVDAYINGLKPMIELAAMYGVTRQGIYKVLCSAGIDTSKQAAHMSVSCSCCGKEIKRLRCQIRKANHLFCSQECYFAWLKHGNGNPLIMHRNSSRIARGIISKVFALRPEHIVHHEDRNQYHNALANLKVFANQGDHIRYHRGFTVPVLFDGSVTL